MGGRRPEEAQEKAEVLKTLLARLEAGEDREEIQKEFNRNFSKVSVREIMEAERAFLDEHVHKVQSIQEICQLHSEMFGEALEKVHLPETEQPGHPLYMLLKENLSYQKLLEEEVLGRPIESKSTAEWQKIWGTLQELRRHYDKKDHLLFPILEEIGINGPSKVMWANENKNLKGMKNLLRHLETGRATTEELQNAAENLLGMMKLERDFLAPMAMDHLAPEKWVQIGREALLQGYVGMEEGDPDLLAAETWLSHREEKETKLSSSEEGLTLPTGRLSAKMARAILNTTELDITVIDENDRVIYFNEMSPRYFSRPTTVLGRDVFLCHPPHVVEIVRSVIEGMKNKTKREQSFFFPRGEYRLLITYTGLYDEEDNYMGCMEKVQDIRPMEKYFSKASKQIQDVRVATGDIREEEAASAVAEEQNERENGRRELHLTTTLNELLEAYPQAFEALEAISPMTAKMKNPALRAMMGNIATIEKIARRIQMEPEDLLRRLRQALEEARPQG